MTLEKCRTCRGCHTCSRFRVTCTLVVIGEAHLATLCDHSRSRLTWFWNCFLGARLHHLPLVGLVATSPHATASPLQASYDLRPFFKFACLTRDTIESCLLRLGIEAVASTLLLPGLSCLDVSSMSRGGDAHCLPYLLSWHIPA